MKRLKKVLSHCSRWLPYAFAIPGLGKITVKAAEPTPMF